MGTEKFYATDTLRRGVNELKLRGRRQYEIARSCGYTNPTQFTDILRAARPARGDDPRIVALCRFVNLPFERAFEAVRVEPQEHCA